MGFLALHNSGQDGLFGTESSARVFSGWNLRILMDSIRMIKLQLYVVIPYHPLE
jgi:hypothetical protein